MPAVFLSLTFILITLFVIVIFVAVCLETENPGWATTAFCLYAAFLVWGHKDVVFDFISQNPLQTAGFALAYVACGVVWSIFKWIFYIKSVFSRIKDAKVKLDKDEHWSGKTEEEKVKKVSSILTNDSNKYDTIEKIAEKIKPDASKKKSLIVSWITYFPISFVATVLNDPFRKFFEWVYETISGVYDKITDYYKKNLIKDLK